MFKILFNKNIFSTQLNFTIFFCKLFFWIKRSAIEYIRLKRTNVRAESTHRIIIASVPRKTRLKSLPKNMKAIVSPTVLTTSIAVLSAFSGSESLMTRSKHDRAVTYTAIVDISA